jgi:hypothetical protein
MIRVGEVERVHEDFRLGTGNCTSAFLPGRSCSGNSLVAEALKLHDRVRLPFEAVVLAVETSFLQQICYRLY